MSNPKTPVAVAAAAVAAIIGAVMVNRFYRKRREISDCNSKRVDNNDSPEPSPEFDVLCIGAGPAGSTAAYFLARQGLKVCLVDKKVFPRPKPCGDAWCAPALNILDEMGILKKMEADGIVGVVKRGGLISPFGYACINTGDSTYGDVTGCKTYAIKRYIADNYLVCAAAESKNVTLFEGTEVVDCVFSSNHWQVMTRKGDEKDNDSTVNYAAKIVLVCDGSTSYMAQKLGIIPKGSQPEAVCSHAYIRGDTHNWHDADGVMLFNNATLPGYSALFRHYNNDMYLGTYILPGGKATSRSIAPFENDAVQNHPYIRSAFGDKWQYEEKRVVAPIRLGGVPKSYGRQLLLVGDAAGHVDPITGEGIHTAMIAAKIASQTVGEMFTKNNFSEEACRAYELRCYDAFVHEFYYSSLCAKVIYYFPIAIDALAVVGQRRGQGFLDFFGEVMTGVRPKSDFLKFDLLFELAGECMRQIILRYILRKKPLIPNDIGLASVNSNFGKERGSKGA